jgi:hypothetical protein
VSEKQVPKFVCDRAKRNPGVRGWAVASFQCSCGERHAHRINLNHPAPNRRQAHCNPKAKNNHCATGHYIVLGKDVQVKP